MNEREIPPRVVVTHPRTRAARRADGSLARVEIRSLTPIGGVYLRSLVRSQLRLSVTVLIGLGLLIGALPLVGAVSPELFSVRVLGVPLPWFVLAVLVFPALFVGGAWYVRAAERTERRFVDLVERR